MSDQIHAYVYFGLDHIHGYMYFGRMLRYIHDPIQELALRRHKMVFVSGPRQVGKTTFAKSLQEEFSQFEYRSWDILTFRRLWATDPNRIQESFDFSNPRLSRLLILDEIHKSKGWKNKLKGLYDELGEKLNLIVTGSARLNIYKKGSDSLMGRYMNFRLHPLSFGEIQASGSLSPEEWKRHILHPKTHSNNKVIEKLLRYSGFPEPYLTASDKIMNIWRKDHHDKLIREDLRDLSRIPELSQVEMLTALLPDKVGSPLSVQSLREDLEVGFDTVKRWLKYLEELYFFFELKPWTRSIPRSLKKEGKIYLYDWTEVEDEGLRFENLIASHLLKACHFWQDTGEGDFDLHYLRNKEKQEVDFLITKKKSPWLMIEAKLNDKSLDLKSIQKYSQYLKCPYLQVILPDDAWMIRDNVGLISASNLLEHLP